MGFGDQLLNLPPPRPLPKEKARVLEMGAGAKPCPTEGEEEEALKPMHKCPCGGVPASSIGCDDPAVDNGFVEAELAPRTQANVLVSESSGCTTCLMLLRSLHHLDEGHSEADEVIFAGDEDGSASISTTAAQNALGSSTPSDQTTEEMDDCLSAGYETPTESVFNPFAPGPEELGKFAPMIVPRVSRARKVPLRRQLRFDSSDSSPSSGDDDDDGAAKGTELMAGSSRRDDELDEEDKRLLASLYATHYNFILSSLLEELSTPARGSSLSDGDGSPTTPSAVPFLTGVAERCPGAPVRHVSKSRKLDPAICRKLDFS